MIAILLGVGLSVQTLTDRIVKVGDGIAYSAASRYAQLVHAHARDYGLDPLLLVALLKVESNFGRYVLNDTNDYGPMQINQFWFSRLDINAKDVMHRDKAIEIASQILVINRSEANARGCWWSLYHSWTPKLRKLYEKRVKGVFAQWGISDVCSVKSISEIGS